MQATDFDPKLQTVAFNTLVQYFFQSYSYYYPKKTKLDGDGSHRGLTNDVYESIIIEHDYKGLELRKYSDDRKLQQEDYDELSIKIYFKYYGRPHIQVFLKPKTQEVIYRLNNEFATTEDRVDTSDVHGYIHCISPSQKYQLLDILKKKINDFVYKYLSEIV